MNWLNSTSQRTLTLSNGGKKWQAMTNEQLACLLEHVRFRVRHASSFLDGGESDVEACERVLKMLADDLDQQEGRLLGEIRNVV